MVGGAVRPVVGAGEHVAPVEDAELVVHQPVCDHRHAPAGRFQLGKGQPARLEIDVVLVARQAQGHGYARPLPRQNYLIIIYYSYYLASMIAKYSSCNLFTVIGIPRGLRSTGAVRMYLNPNLLRSFLATTFLLFTLPKM